MEIANKSHLHSSKMAKPSSKRDNSWMIDYYKMVLSSTSRKHITSHPIEDGKLSSEIIRKYLYMSEAFKKKNFEAERSATMWR